MQALAQAEGAGLIGFEVGATQTIGAGEAPGGNVVDDAVSCTHPGFSTAHGAILVADRVMGDAGVLEDEQRGVAVGGKLDAPKRLHHLGSLGVVVLVVDPAGRGGGVDDDEARAVFTGGLRHPLPPGTVVAAEGEVLEANGCVDESGVGAIQAAPTPLKVLLGVGEGVLFVKVEDARLSGGEIEKWQSGSDSDSSGVAEDALAHARVACEDDEARLIEKIAYEPLRRRGGIGQHFRG